MKKFIIDVLSCDQDFFKKLMNQNLWIWEVTDEEYPEYEEDDFKEPYV